MSTPTRQEIIDAHKALDEWLHLSLSLSITDKQDNDSLRFQEMIYHALPPLPRPTMAEVEWDDDEHYLAEAEHPEYGKVIMLGMNFFFGRIRIMSTKEKDALWHLAHPESLTPTGRRYTLTEAQE